MGVGEQSLAVNHKGCSRGPYLSSFLPRGKSIPVHLGNFYATDAVSLNAHAVVALIVVLADIIVVDASKMVAATETAAILDDSYENNIQKANPSHLLRKMSVDESHDSMIVVVPRLLLQLFNNGRSSEETCI